MVVRQPQPDFAGRYRCDLTLDGGSGSLNLNLPANASGAPGYARQRVGECEYAVVRARKSGSDEAGTWEIQQLRQRGP